jgi:hypothetical protein
MYDAPHNLILNQEKERVKFYEYTVIICEVMDGEWVFRGVGNMQYVAKMEILSRSAN